MSQQAYAHAAPALAAAFDTAFWIAVVLIATAMILALLLPRPPAQRSA